MYQPPFIGRPTVKGAGEKSEEVSMSSMSPKETSYPIKMISRACAGQFKDLSRRGAGLPHSQYHIYAGKTKPLKFSVFVAYALYLNNNRDLMKLKEIFPKDPSKRT